MHNAACCTQTHRLRFPTLIPFLLENGTAGESLAVERRGLQAHGGRRPGDTAPKRGLVLLFRAGETGLSANDFSRQKYQEDGRVGLHYATGFGAD